VRQRQKAGSPSQIADGDEALVRRAVAGDRPAFEALVNRHQDLVYRLAHRLTGSAADAEEIVQETFLSAYRRLGTFRGEAKFSTWLCRIATNAARMMHRGRSRHPTEPLDDYLPGFDREGRHARDVDHARAAAAEEILDRARLAHHAREALQRLPDRYRTPFVLRDLEEMPTAEVAAVLGVSGALVRQRVHRARLMLRGYMSHLVGVEP
jgi:RNA polymerase sigma-70 factor (ECF subfamily)